MAGMSFREMARGLREALVDPLAQDIRSGNRMLKKVRDQYPTIDNIAGIHPTVAAAQVANDAMAGEFDGSTMMNVAQAIPIIKNIRGVAGRLPKQAAIRAGDNNLMVNMPATVKKNVALTGTQILGEPVEAHAPPKMEVDPGHFSGLQPGARQGLRAAVLKRTQR